MYASASDIQKCKITWPKYLFECVYNASTLLYDCQLKKINTKIFSYNLLLQCPLLLNLLHYYLLLFWACQIIPLHSVKRDLLYYLVKTAKMAFHQSNKIFVSKGLNVILWLVDSYISFQLFRLPHLAQELCRKPVVVGHLALLYWRVCFENIQIIR